MPVIEGSEINFDLKNKVKELSHAYNDGSKEQSN